MINTSLLWLAIQACTFIPPNCKPNCIYDPSWGIKVTNWKCVYNKYKVDLNIRSPSKAKGKYNE